MIRIIIPMLQMSDMIAIPWKLQYVGVHYIHGNAVVLMTIICFALCIFCLSLLGNVADIVQ